jgi:hypothetical protein
MRCNSITAAADVHWVKLQMCTLQVPRPKPQLLCRMQQRPEGGRHQAAVPAHVLAGSTSKLYLFLT